VLARRSVEVALGQPDRLAVYVRERARLAGDQRDQLRRTERAVQQVWGRAIPAGERAEVRAVRIAGILGVLGALARRPARLARPRLDDLLTASIAAAVTGPATCPAAPPRAPPWAVPVSKRDEILGAALRLSAERGFPDVGIDEIGEAAGISGPTVYHYFGSKAELLVDAYDQVGQRVVVGVEQALGGARSADDALDRLCRSYAGIAVASADLIIVTSREGFSLPESDRPRLSRRRRSVHDAWLAVLTELRPELAEAELRELVRLVFPLQNQAALAVPARLDLSAEVAQIARRWCHGDTSS
jgi:AcrR family transcriptional regulator